MKKFILIGSLFGFLSGLLLMIVLPSWLQGFAYYLQFLFLPFLLDLIATFLGNNFEIQFGIWFGIIFTTIIGTLYGAIVYGIFSLLKKRKIF